MSFPLINSLGQPRGLRLRLGIRGVSSDIADPRVETPSLSDHTECTETKDQSTTPHKPETGWGLGIAHTLPPAPVRLQCTVLQHKQCAMSDDHDSCARELADLVLQGAQPSLWAVQ